MKKGLLILVAVVVFLIGAPAYAQDGNDWTMEGTFSAGVGGGFSSTDVDTAPFVLSGKYWDPSWELGVEVFTDFTSESDTYDQIAQAWLAYRYDLNTGDDVESGTTYIGIGASGLFQELDQFGNGFGPIALIGWDSDVWGLEAKAAYYDPLVFSLVAYYHFNSY